MSAGVLTAAIIAVIVILGAWLGYSLRRQRRLFQPSLLRYGRKRAQSITISKLVAGDPANPLVEITRLDTSAKLRSEPLALGRRHMIELSNIVRHAPELAISVANASANTYVLRFAPEVAQQISTGTATIMQSLDGGLRGIAVNAEGTIVAHGSLFPTAGLKAAATAAAVWQVLAIVTAQKYLVDINDRLERVEHQIDEIKDRLQTGDIATLISNIKYLRTLKETIETQNLNEMDVTTFSTSLETIDRECGRLIEMYLMLMSNYRDTFAELDLSGWFSANVSPAIQYGTNYEQAARISLMAIYVKGIVAQLRCALPVERGLALHRLEELQSDIARWYKHQKKFVKLFKKRTQEDLHSTVFNLWGADWHNRELLLSSADQAQQELNELSASLEAMVATARQHLEAQIAAPAQPLALVVTLNERREIEQVSQLLEA